MTRTIIASGALIARASHPPPQERSPPTDVARCLRTPIVVSPGCDRRASIRRPPVADGTGRADAESLERSPAAAAGGRNGEVILD